MDKTAPRAPIQKKKKKTKALVELDIKMKGLAKATADMTEDRIKTQNAAKAVLTMYRVECPDGDYLLNYTGVMDMVSRKRMVTLPVSQTPNGVINKYLLAHAEWRVSQSLVASYCKCIQELRDKMPKS